MFAPPKCGRLCVHAALIGALSATTVVAQTQYRNLDAGRPGRVEDAAVAARYSLDVDLVPFQIERFAGGTMRYRAEPKLGYGVLPFTEIELRAPFVQVNPPPGGARAVAGLAGLSIGVTRALTLESTTRPAVALGGELSVPVGNIAPSRPSFLLKTMMTRSAPVGRVHLNLGIGTYAVRAPAAEGACTAFRFPTPGDTTCSGPPIIIDVPCVKAPSQGGRLALLRTRACMSSRAETTGVAASRTGGARWLAGLGVDHSFALHSTVLTADLVAERFIGLYRAVDWTAEAGIRRQLTPVVVFDVGVGWHFAGTVRSASLVVGATYEFATPPLFGR